MEKEEATQINDTEELKKKARAISIKEGSAYSVQDGFALRSITPYAVAIGGKPYHISLLTSLPSILGSLSQILTFKLMEKYSRKRIISIAVLLQALMWLLVIIPGALYFLFNINSQISSSLLVLFYTLLVIFGSFAGPAWSSWMRDLIPNTERGSYFGKRNRICGFIALISMIIAGFILDYYKNTKLFIVFAAFFFIGFIFRSISSYLFTKQYEPEFKTEQKDYFSFFQFIKKMRHNNFGKFVIFTALVSLSTAIASPFFAVYMLKNLEFNTIDFGYVFYFIITISAFISTILFMPWWGKFSDKYGNLKTMKITGILIPLVPLLWIASLLFNDTLLHLIIFLFVVEAFSGWAWAGFNLSAGNFIYDAVSKERMALCVAYYNILHGIGTFLGASIGGLMISFNLVSFGLDTILFVFLISGIPRFLIYFIMISKIKEVREVKSFNLEDELSIKRISFPRIQIFDFIQAKLFKPRP